jgi:hypothetical protein
VSVELQEAAGWGACKTCWLADTGELPGNLTVSVVKPDEQSAVLLAYCLLSVYEAPREGEATWTAHRFFLGVH